MTLHALLIQPFVEFGFMRRALVATLALGLACGPMGRQPFWIKKYGVTRLPIADKVHDFGLYLPNHANITPEDIAYVAKHFREVAQPC